MKQMLLILFAVCVQTAYGQTLYTSLIDSVATDIGKRELFYTADSNDTEFDRDSNITKALRIRFKYADSRGKKLLMVDELRWAAGDTIGVVYYFRDREPIKISATLRSRNKLISQSFYFKNNKLVFPSRYFGNIFELEDYIERSKKYLKFKSKKLSLKESTS